MGEDILWTDDAKAELRAIDRLTAMRILDALADYRRTGIGDVKFLSGYKPRQSRLRIGDYRLRFRYVSGVLEVIGVGHRREIYRKT